MLEAIVDGQKATLYKGKPLSECPKTYKRFKVVGHNMGNSYNPSTLTLYRAKDNTLRYEIFRDGCFYPFYGRIVFK